MKAALAHTGRACDGRVLFDKNDCLEGGPVPPNCPTAEF